METTFHEKLKKLLKESKYLIYFSYSEQYLTKEEYEHAIKLADEIGAMVWSTIQKI